MSSHTVPQKDAWEYYFGKPSLMMDLMIRIQKIFLTPLFVRIARPFVEKGDKVLEAGCGTAFNTLMICSKLKADAWGVDISQSALNRAHELARGMQISLRTQIGDIRNMPFQNGSFNFVWNQGVIEHFREPIPVIAEMGRVGRKVLVAVPRRSLLRGIVQKIKDVLGLAANDFFQLYSEKQLSELCSQVAGFKVKASGSFNCLYIFSWTWVFSVRDSDPAVDPDKKGCQ